MPSIVLTNKDFQALPEPFQKLLLAQFTSGTNFINKDDDRPAVKAPGDDDEELPDLSPSQTKKACESFTDKTKDFIRQIVSFPEDGFRLSDLAERVGVDPSKMRGMWGGITRVTRRLVDNDDVSLFSWTEDPDGEYRGRLSPMTYRSFRKTLGMT